MTPRVSVVVATRNRRAMLARALASVDAQTFRDYEIVVVDDGSTDGTATWLAAARPQDRLIAVAPAQGAAAARNHGVGSARGAIVAFLDDDDVWLPRYLAAQVAQLDADPRADLCTTGHVEVDPAGRVEYPDLRPLLDSDNELVQMLAACPIHTLSVVACRRVALARTGPFDETLEVVHDLDWYLRLLMAGGRIANDPTPLVERAIPGGLVTQHRRWYTEERALHRRACAAARVTPASQRCIRAARALLFAQIALSRHDFAFALARIGEAMATAPVVAVRMAATRLLRQGRGAFAWNAGAAAR